MNHRNLVNVGKRTVYQSRCAKFLAFLCFLLLGSAQLAWSADIHEEDMAKIGPGVFEQLLDTGKVNVIIAFAEPLAAKAVSLNMVTMKSQIADTRSHVLSQLVEGDYEARHNFTAVPAMAGRVTSQTGLMTLAEHPYVKRIDLDIGGTGSLADSVPVTGADLRHFLGNTGTGVVVAVLDSGLDTDHDNLSDNLVAEACFLDNDGAINGSGLCPNGSDRQTGLGAAEDDAGHGSHVSGIITSNGTQGSVGMAPDASIVAIKVTAGPTFSGAFSFFSEIVAALDYIINNPQLGVQVINMSIGTNSLFSGDCDASSAGNMAGAAAINTLRVTGVTAFASAGNNSSSTQMSSPACLSNVISVGASDNADNIASFTNSNSSTDIFAPGVSVLSSNLSNGTTTASGTSMSSPHAAGCAALLIESGEAVTPNQIETRLETSAFTVTDPGNGLTFPRIDCISLNQPPTCDANGPYVAECSVNINLDGSGSVDPDAGTLTFAWEGPFTGSPESGINPSVVFPSPTGIKLVDLTVQDDVGFEDSCSTQVTVQDTLRPTISVPSNRSAECAGAGGTAVNIGIATASDICDTSVNISNNAPLLFPLGDTIVTWTATDDDGNQDAANQTVSIVDTTPPNFELSVSPVILWPPNHKLATINAQITMLTDICDPDPTIKLVSITSNEPDNGNGDGNTVNDIQGADFGTDDREFQLRMERSGKGSDRVYTITYMAEDDSGNQTTKQAVVTVPKSKGKN